MTATKKYTKAQLKAIFTEADQAGRAAGLAKRPVPMLVVEREDPLDDSSPIVRRYAPVEGGACGYAWVSIRPGGSQAARYAKQVYAPQFGEVTGYSARPDSYAGGLSISVWLYGQSMERKAAHAEAMAQVLRAHGINAYADSRMN